MLPIEIILYDIQIVVHSIQVVLKYLES